MIGNLYSHTMSACNLDDEATLRLSLPVLNRDIAPFNSSVFLSSRVKYSTFEDRKQRLRLSVA
jgi:hypothetical protein